MQVQDGEGAVRLGPIEILVCNHGIGSAHEQVVWEQKPEVWDETMRVNLEGPFHLSRLALRGIVERSARQEARSRSITIDQVWEERASLYPPGRVATPQEVAEMIAFLVSEEASGINGEAIRVALGSVY